MDTLAKRIDDLANEINFNGSILISKNQEIILAKGYGYACFEHEVENESNTVHRVASITKTFTAACILKLVEDGRISLNHTLDMYIPDFFKGDQITIHHVLSNSSGIANFSLDMDFFDILNSDSILNSLIDLVKDKSLQFKPGSKFNYSIAGYLVLQFIIEKVSGLSYETYLKQNFFDKLEIFNTGLEEPNRVIKNKSHNYKIEDNKIMKADYIDMRIAGGGGGLYSNVYDIYRFNNSILNHEILSKESCELMFEKHIKADEYNSYGYGMIIAEGIVENTFVKKYYHPGGGNGVRSMNTIYPNKKIQAILISNIEDRETFNKMYSESNKIINE